MKKIISFTIVLLSCLSCKEIKYNNFKKKSVEINDRIKKLKCGEIIFTKKENRLWTNFKIDTFHFKAINSSNHQYFINNCNSVINSPDKQVYLFREVLIDEIKNNYDYYEAPYIGVDKKTQTYVNYVGILENKINFLSLSNLKADFVNSHDFFFEDNIYYLLNEFIEKAPDFIKTRKLILNKDDIKNIIELEPISFKNIIYFNDIAYYLEQSGNNNEAIYLLEKIIAQFPNRVVAYLNLADAYWNTNQKEKAKAHYKKYYNVMHQQNKNLSKIPNRVKERM